jgi:hypothetical protein
MIVHAHAPFQFSGNLLHILSEGDWIYENHYGRLRIVFVDILSSQAFLCSKSPFHTSRTSRFEVRRHLPEGLGSIATAASRP